MTIKNIDLGIGDGPSYRDCPRQTVSLAAPESDINGSLGRTVEIVQVGSQTLEEAFLQLGRQCFSTAKHLPQGAAPFKAGCFQKNLEHGRDKMQGRDALRRDQPGQISTVLMTARLCHNQTGPGHERPKEFQTDTSKLKGVSTAHDRGSQGISLLHPKQIAYAEVRIRRAFAARSNDV
jgi:hypothetical protein